MPSLECQNLSVNLFGGGLFRNVRILHEISFSLSNGDRLAIVGSNGAGKSTLLKTLGGILHPAEGSLSIEGRVSTLFNISLGTRPSSSGRTNIILRNLIEGRSMDEIQRKLPDIIKFTELGEKIDYPMEQYSAGMAMRTVFAAATAFDPEILLLDEWIGAGDLKFRKKSRRRMKELVERSSIIVMATHRKQLATDICNLGLHLEKGRIMYFGDIESAWASYEEFNQ